MQISHLNNRGFTLVEMMIATLITVVVLLGLLKAVEVAMEQNTRNQMREEMTMVAEARMNSFRIMPFTMISTCGNASCNSNTHTYAPETVASRLRSLGRSYTVTRSTRTSSDTDRNSVDLGVRVHSWVYRNMSTSFEMHSVRSQ